MCLTHNVKGITKGVLEGAVKLSKEHVRLARMGALGYGKERLSRHWRPLNGGVNLMTLVLEGENFKDGILKRQKTPQLVGAMA